MGEDTAPADADVRIALDIEGVLADPHAAFLDEYNDQYGTDFTVDDITEWGFGRVRDHFADATGHDSLEAFLHGVDGEFDGFLDISAAYWEAYTDQDAPDRMPPLEPDIGRYIDDLHTALQETGLDYQIDVVTAREGVDDQLQTWLADHGIREGAEYTDFVVSDDKHELPYNVYIDDNPWLAEALTADDYQDNVLLLYDRPYNQDVATANAVRVTTHAETPDTAADVVTALYG